MGGNILGFGIFWLSRAANTLMTPWVPSFQTGDRSDRRCHSMSPNSLVRSLVERGSVVLNQSARQGGRTSEPVGHCNTIRSAFMRKCEQTSCELNVQPTMIGDENLADTSLSPIRPKKVRRPFKRLHGCTRPEREISQISYQSRLYDGWSLFKRSCATTQGCLLELFRDQSTPPFKSIRCSASYDINECLIQPHRLF